MRAICCHGGACPHLLVIAALIGLELVAAPARAQTHNPANGHYYLEVATPAGITWPDAKSAAEQRYLRGYQGHLATITSPAENIFLAGGELSEGAAQFYWLGGVQSPTGEEPAGGWGWVTGEPWVYSNWIPEEPNDQDGNEDVLHFGPGTYGAWNDDPPDATNRGYIVEFSIPLTGACCGDWNRDHAVNPSDIAEFVSDWMVSLSGGTLRGDYNGDGSIGPIDVAHFVADWLADAEAGC